MDVEKLIELVRDQDAIYNPKHPKHRNRDFIAGVWRKIARELNSTDSEVKAKWQNLRNNFMREIRKHKCVVSGSDANSAPKVTWAYFKLLLFLNPSLQHKETSGNVPDIEDLQEHDGSLEVPYEQSQEESQELQSQQEPLRESSTQSQERVKHDLQTPSISTPRRSDDSHKKRKKPNRSSETNDDIDRQYLAHLKAISAKAEDDKDPDLLFLRSLLPNIKQLGPMENLEFKGEVIALLHKKMASRSTFMQPLSNPPSVASPLVSPCSTATEQSSDGSRSNNLDIGVPHYATAMVLHASTKQLLHGTAGRYDNDLETSTLDSNYTIQQL